MFGARAHPRLQQHPFRSRHFGAGAHPARARYRRRLRPVEDHRRTQPPLGRLSAFAWFGRAARLVRKETEMALIDPLLNKLIRKGRLTIVMPDGKPRSFGPG